MKNHKQLLSDFYLKLLAIPLHSKFRINNQHLYAGLRHSLAKELNEDEETIQRIFERMAMEDRQV
jgi:hypothetical protein